MTGLLGKGIFNIFNSPLRLCCVFARKIKILSILLILSKKTLRLCVSARTQSHRLYRVQLQLDKQVVAADIGLDGDEGHIGQAVGL